VSDAVSKSGGRPARIVFWAGSFERAGTQRFLVELLARLDRTRFEPAVFSTSARGELLPRLEALGVPVHEFGTGRHALSPRTVAGLGRAALFLRRGNVDVLSCLLGITTLFGPFVGRLAGVPVVVNNQRNLSYWMRGRAREAVYGFVSRRIVDAVLVNSEAAERELTDRFRVPRAKIVQTGVGVDVEAYAGTPRNEAIADELGVRGRRVVGIVAKLSSVKGHEHFLAAAAEISRSFDDVRFLVVGDGPRRAELEGMAALLAISDRVRFVGVRDDVPTLLRLMDVFVLSSVSEGSPNAVMEAMAAGVPVVASDVGGLREIVADGVSGLLVPAGDSVSLAKAVLGLLTDPARASAMGAAGQSRAREKYDVGRVVANVEAVLSKLLIEARARRRQGRLKETLLGLGRVGSRV
jgi:glycosyltransferase involved in cell wall biosynthesis